MRYSTQDKAQVLDLLRKGFNPSQIAKMPGVIVPRRCIARWRAEWIEEGKLKAKETAELDILAGQVDSRVRRVLGLIDRSLEKAEREDLSLSDLSALTMTLNRLADALRKLQAPELQRGGTQMRNTNSPQNETEIRLPDLSKMSPEELKAIIARTNEMIIQDLVQKATDADLADINVMRKSFPEISCLTSDGQRRRKKHSETSRLTQQMFDRVRELRDAPPIPPKWIATESQHSVLFASLDEKEQAHITFIVEGAKNPDLSPEELAKLRDKITPYCILEGDDWLKTVLSIIQRHISGKM